MQAKEWQRARFSQITLVPPSKNHLSKPKTTNKILFFDVKKKKYCPDIKPFISA